MMTDYQRIEKAILYIKENFKDQPDLDQVAREVYLSPFHFQRLFKTWAGVTPKKFLQLTSLEYAKQLLSENRSVAATSFETGLSGTGRLHDLFINIEGMTPGEYKNGGQALDIQYSFATTPFGDILSAATPKGLCHLSFVEDEVKSVEMLKSTFPNARFVHKTDFYQLDALQIFKKDWTDLTQIKLHLLGTSFQLKVWQALLNIPLGQVSTYSSIAQKIQNPKASRAVGTAIGNNPVAYLIPCHRVIKSTGIIGEYHWGNIKKTAILGWEAARVDTKMAMEAQVEP